MEKSMDTALARLRAKTDRELGILVDRQLHRSRELVSRGAYRDAARDFLSAQSLLTVVEIPPAERARLENTMQEVRKTIELPRTAVA
jgi:hypothetical protein